MRMRYFVAGSLLIVGMVAIVQAQPGRRAVAVRRTAQFLIANKAVQEDLKISEEQVTKVTDWSWSSGQVSRDYEGQGGRFGKGGGKGGSSEEIRAKMAEANAEDHQGRLQGPRRRAQEGTDRPPSPDPASTAGRERLHQRRCGKPPQADRQPEDLDQGDRRRLRQGTPRDLHRGQPRTGSRARAARVASGAVFLAASRSAPKRRRRSASSKRNRLGRSLTSSTTTRRRPGRNWSAQASTSRS